jgi:putative hydrolase of the HAD superfamily
MIKAIFFDYDGVLTTDKTGSYSICKYISKTTNIDYELFSQEYRKFNDDLLYGGKNHEEIWGSLCKNIGTEISIKYLFEAFKNTPLNEKMFNLVKNLKRKYKTGIITDNKKDRIDYESKINNFNLLFDTIVVSAEIGSGKNEKYIFYKSIENLKMKFNECVFIDNQEKNLVVPKALGMNVIFHDHEKNDVKLLVNNLKKLNVEV